MQGFHISPEKRRYGTHTYIYTYTLFKLEIQSSQFVVVSRVVIGVY